MLLALLMLLAGRGGPIGGSLLLDTDRAMGGAPGIREELDCDAAARFEMDAEPLRAPRGGALALPGGAPAGLAERGGGGGAAGVAAASAPAALLTQRFSSGSK